jgi:ribosome modulation factor
MRMNDVERINKAAREGVRDYCRGAPLEACPYKPGTPEHKEWTATWREAADIDKEQYLGRLN